MILTSAKTWLAMIWEEMRVWPKNIEEDSLLTCSLKWGWSMQTKAKRVTSDYFRRPEKWSWDMTKPSPCFSTSHSCPFSLPMWEMLQGDSDTSMTPALHLVLSLLIRWERLCSWQWIMQCTKWVLYLKQRESKRGRKDMEVLCLHGISFRVPTQPTETKTNMELIHHLLPLLLLIECACVFCSDKHRSSILCQSNFLPPSNSDW